MSLSQPNLPPLDRIREQGFCFRELSLLEQTNANGVERLHGVFVRRAKHFGLQLKRTNE